MAAAVRAAISVRRRCRSRAGSACAPDSDCRGRNSMILNSVLAFGLVLATATQLRFGDTPFGPGEMCLVVWIGVCLFRQAGRPTLAPNPALSHVATFWLI